MQADETGIVPEFYGGPEASGTHETLAPPEENTEARLWGPTPLPPRTSERETVEPEALRVTNETPETRRALITEENTEASTEPVATRNAEAASAVVSAAPIPARASPPPGDIPVATPIAITREGAMRLVRAGIPLPDAYKAVLGEADGESVPTWETVLEAATDYCALPPPLGEQGILEMILSV